MSQPSKPLKTVFIIAAGVPGNKSTEAMAIYYRGIVQPYEMTFRTPGKLFGIYSFGFQ